MNERDFKCPHCGKKDDIFYISRRKVTCNNCFKDSERKGE